MDLLIIDGGIRTLDMRKATIAHIYRPEVGGGISERTWLFFDDQERKERQVLQVLFRSTLAGRKSRQSSSVTMTTIYGYHPETGKWGPEERSSYMDVTWENAKRLTDQIRTFARENFKQFNGGYSWYRGSHFS